MFSAIVDLTGALAGFCDIIRQINLDPPLPPSGIAFITNNPVTSEYTANSGSRETSPSQNQPYEKKITNNQQYDPEPSSPP